MSIDVQTEIRNTCLYKGGLFNVLMAMADCANTSQGDGIYPGIDLLAANARLEVRATQDNIKRLRRDAVVKMVDADGNDLPPEEPAKGGRGCRTEYRIDLERVQELQGLHEAEPGHCPFCAAREKRAKKKQQQPPKKGAVSNTNDAVSDENGAESHSHIEPSEPSVNRHSLAGASERGNIASLGKGSSERWPELRSMIAKTWPGGFPAENEIAGKAEFERQTRTHDPGLIIECAGLHGRAKTTQQDQRGKSAGKLIMKKPSNWLKEGEWQGYIPQAEDVARQEAKVVTALGNIRRALGEGLFALLREKMPDVSLAMLDGIGLEEPARFVHTSGFQRTLLERLEREIERQLGQRPSYTLVKKAG